MCLQCIPLSSLWTGMPGKCIQIETLFTVMASVFPSRMVLRNDIDSRQRPQCPHRLYHPSPTDPLPLAVEGFANPPGSTFWYLRPRRLVRFAQIQIHRLTLTNHELPTVSAYLASSDPVMLAPPHLTMQAVRPSNKRTPQHERCELTTIPHDRERYVRRHVVHHRSLRRRRERLSALSASTLQQACRKGRNRHEQRHQRLQRLFAAVVQQTEIGLGECQHRHHGGSRRQEALCAPQRSDRGRGRRWPTVEILLAPK